MYELDALVKVKPTAMVKHLLLHFYVELVFLSKENGVGYMLHMPDDKKGGTQGAVYGKQGERWGQREQLPKDSERHAEIKRIEQIFVRKLWLRQQQSFHLGNVEGKTCRLPSQLRIE